MSRTREDFSNQLPVRHKDNASIRWKYFLPLEAPGTFVADKIPRIPKKQHCTFTAQVESSETHIPLPSTTRLCPSSHLTAARHDVATHWRVLSGPSMQQFKNIYSP